MWHLFSSLFLSVPREGYTSWLCIFWVSSLIFCEYVCFTVEMENYVDRTYVCNLVLHENYGRDFAWVKLIKARPSARPPPPPPTTNPLILVVFLLIVLRLSLCCSSLFVHRLFLMRLLFCHCSHLRRKTNSCVSANPTDLVSNTQLC